jgi:phenylacetate-CoA ligase
MVTEAELNTARDATWGRLNAALEENQIKQLRKEITTRAFWSELERKKHQSNALEFLISSAILSVPYYRSWSKEHRSHIKRLADFPVVSRRMVASNMGLFISRDTQTNRIPGNDLYVTTTSGSTGQPVTHIKRQQNEGLANSVFRERISQRYNLPFKYERIDLGLRVVGQPIVEGHLLPGAVLSWNMRGFREQRKHFVEEYLAILGVADPVLISGVPQRVLELAEVAERKNFFCRPSVVITSYEPLHETTRLRLTEAFNCPVTSIYGTAELGNFAIQCKEGNFHFDSDLVIVEILDENGEAVSLGGTGHVVVTSLCSQDMPLIRYDTGDLGTRLPTNKCECGDTSPCFGGLVGRSTDMLESKEGIIYSPYALFNYLGFRGLSNFQILHEAPGFLKVVYRAEATVDAQLVEEFTKLVEKLVEEKTVVEFDNNISFLTAENGKRNPFVNTFRD